MQENTTEKKVSTGKEREEIREIQIGNEDGARNQKNIVMFHSLNSRSISRMKING